MRSLETLASRGTFLKLYGLCLTAISLVHYLHGRDADNVPIPSRMAYTLDRAEGILFMLVLLTAAASFFARQLTNAKWRRTVARITSGKIDYWALAVKEISYLLMLGAGVYWAYACMVE